MNVAELLAKLVHLPGDMPVVLSGGGEMSPAYGELAAIDVRELRRQAEPYRGLPIEYSDWKGRGSLDPAPVLVLDMDPPYQPVVDAEVIEARELRQVPCPSCGNLLSVGTWLPGDQAVCSKCQQIVAVPPPTGKFGCIEIFGDPGPTWRQIIAEALTPMTARDRAVLAGADAAEDDCPALVLGPDPVPTPPALAAAQAAHRCLACDTPCGTKLLCPECAKLAWPGINS